ncbi:MAG: fimbrillin family protein [Bacteroidales bacterium]|nr:fimbrillin family protein [Bacteroidales bacterium]
MKKYFIPVAMVTTLLASAGCSSDVVEDLMPTNQKSLIEFSMSEGIQSGPAQRAVAASAFPEGTNIIMHIRSNENGETTNVRSNKALAVANVHDDHSDLTFDPGQQRYWDDAFGRSAYLSVYAVAVPGTGNSFNTKLQNNLSGGLVENTWTTCNDADAIQTTWAVTTDKQTDAILKNEDLVYSNNIQADPTLGKDGRTWYDWDHSTWVPAAHTGVEGKHGDGCLRFLNETTDPTSRGYFDRGHLKFTHALSRMTITLVEGAGFDNSSNADFQFTSTKVDPGSNIRLKQMYTGGKLNMKNGKWEDKATNDIEIISGSTTAAEGEYQAQMLPDYVLAENSVTGVMEFEIDNNIYYITQGDLYKALADVAANKDAAYGYADDKFTMMQGINYHFTITVNKKQIDNITATVLEWNKVTAADFPIDNSHVQFTLQGVSGTACSDIKFFRKAEDLGNIYTDDSYTANAFTGEYQGPAAITETNDVTHTFKTNEWYYDNNRTAYHFRTLNTMANNSLAENNPSFSMTHGEKTDEYDYHWGAPMKHDATLSYNPTADEGFKANIHKGITSTTTPLKITEFHMLSWVDVILKTSSDGSKVNLKNATVTVNRIKPQATVDMGTGYIAPTGDLTSQTMTAPSFDGWAGTETVTGAYSWQFIPQTLVRAMGADVNPSYSSAAENDYVGITIRTIDNNEYYIVKRLTDIKVTAVDDNRDHTVGSYIQRWYPGHHYVYSITITKKGITDITATLLNWNKVEAGDIDIDLED